MPNRILREGINSSDRVDALSYEAEVFYRRVMSIVDDYGRFSGDPRLIRADAYPLRTDRITIATIDCWLEECISAGLIRMYRVKDKSFIAIIDFRQQVRSNKSKYPDPEDGEDIVPEMRSRCVADAQHMHSTCVAHEIICSPYSETYSETETYKTLGESGDSNVYEIPQRPKQPGKAERERWFDSEFWPIVWAKIGRGAARKAWVSKISSPELKNQAIAAAKAQGPEILRRGMRPGASVLHPATWLNAERWTDEAPALFSVQEPEFRPYVMPGPDV